MSISPEEAVANSLWQLSDDEDNWPWSMDPRDVATKVLAGLSASGWRLVKVLPADDPRMKETHSRIAVPMVEWLPPAATDG